MTDLHSTIIEALVTELRPHLPRCTLRLCAFPGNTPTIRVDGFGDGNGSVCTLRTTQDGIQVIGAHDDELRYPTIEYCHPDLIDLLVRVIESEVNAFFNIKATIRKRHEARLET